MNGANDYQKKLYLLTKINKMERESFSFYKSFYEGIKLLDDKERLKAYDYIVTYGITGKEPEGDKGVAYMVFILAKPHIDANNKRYEKRLKSLGKKDLSRNGQQ